MIFRADREFERFEDVTPAVSGRVVAVCAKQGDMVVKGEILAFVQP